MKKLWSLDTELGVWMRILAAMIIAVAADFALFVLFALAYPFLIG